jgi:Zn-dependent protease with chaperone function
LGYERRSPIDHPALQHMLLVEPAGRSKLAQWLDSHPTLEERVRRIYGRHMGPMEMKSDATVAPIP